MVGQLHDASAPRYTLMQDLPQPQPAPLATVLTVAQPTAASQLTLDSATEPTTAHSSGCTASSIADNAHISTASTSQPHHQVLEEQEQHQQQQAAHYGHAEAPDDAVPAAQRRKLRQQAEQLQEAVDELAVQGNGDAEHSWRCSRQPEEDQLQQEEMQATSTAVLAVQATAAVDGKKRKRPPLVWTLALHQRFVDAVNQLGGIAGECATPTTLLQVEPRVVSLACTHWHTCLSCCIVVSDMHRHLHTVG